jgi:hypothetical protein
LGAFEAMDGGSDHEALDFFTGKPTAIRGLPFLVD